jgi:hypothetical protein
MVIRRAAVVAGLAVACGTAVARTSVGPDVIVGDITEVLRWGTVNGVTGYSVGTYSCNIGNQLLVWQQNNNQHPVIGQAIYRLKTLNGSTRFEQLGYSWLKHGFLANAGSLCGTCNGQGGQALGPGCADPYSAGLNGQQTGLGPRSEVNPYTGVFPFPYTLGWNQIGNATYKRIPLSNNDVDPALNAGATFIAEAIYVSPDDSSWGNNRNNSSWRRIATQSLQSGGWNFGVAGTTRQQRTALQAWAELDFGVQLVTLEPPGDGQIMVAAKVTDLGGGTWHYEYAVQNVTSHRAVRSFKVPFGTSAMVTNVEFRGCPAHSGEPYSSVAWTPTFAGGITWATETFAANANANALRWGSLFNYRFDADKPPKAGSVELGLFLAGSPASILANLPVPDAADSPGGPCAGDANGDRIVTGADLSVLLSNFGQARPAGTSGDFNADGIVTGQDLSVLLASFGNVCP